MYRTLAQALSTILLFTFWCYVWSFVAVSLIYIFEGVYIYLEGFFFIYRWVKNNTNPSKTPLTQSNVVYKFTYPFRVCLSEDNITPRTYNHIL